MTELKTLSVGPFTIDAALYHADAVGAPEPSLSSSIANLLLERSPYHAWCQHPRLGGQDGDESKAMDDGSAAHAVLFGEAERLFVVQADDWRTKLAREARDEARAMGRIPILERQRETFEKMAVIARNQVAECEELGGIKLEDGKMEQTLVWQEPLVPDGQKELGAERIWCRARLDWLHKDRHVILDYKSTGTSAEPTTWARTQIAAKGYDLQAAHYRHGNALTGGHPEAAYFWLVQEVDPPYCASIVGLTPFAWSFGEEKRIEAVRQWERCMSKSYWPSYTKRICYYETPAWEQARWAERMTVRG